MAANSCGNLDARDDHKLTDTTTERILVRGVNWLGDAVMSTPGLIRLREAKPAAHIAIVTPGKLADLWLSHPAIDEVIPFTKTDGSGNLSKRLRLGSYQKALILPNSFRSAFECWLAGIPERIGYGGGGRAVLLTQVVSRRREEIHMHKRSTPEVRRLIAETPEKNRDRFPQSAHQVYSYLHLVSALGATSSPTPPRLNVATQEQHAFSQKHEIRHDRLVIGLNPGAEYGPAKRWPADYFIECARQVESAESCTWLITGAPADESTAKEIESGIRRTHSVARIHNLAGRTTLRELCIALKTCDAVLTNDTGPMHLAAAVGTPVVVPFGSTSPELTGPGIPGDERQRLLLGQAPCAPCFRRDCPIDLRCLRSILPGQVAAEVLAVARVRKEQVRKE